MTPESEQRIRAAAARFADELVAALADTEPANGPDWLLMAQAGRAVRCTACDFTTAELGSVARHVVAMRPDLTSRPVPDGFPFAGYATLGVPSLLAGNGQLGSSSPAATSP